MYHIAPTSSRAPLVTENSQKESKANNEHLWESNMLFKIEKNWIQDLKISYIYIYVNQLEFLLNKLG